jgi:hypothetical protein
LLRFVSFGVNPYFETALVTTLPMRLPGEQALGSSTRRSSRAVPRRMRKRRLRALHCRKRLRVDDAGNRIRTF